MLSSEAQRRKPALDRVTIHNFYALNSSSDEDGTAPMQNRPLRLHLDNSSVSSDDSDTSLRNLTDFLVSHNHQRNEGAKGSKPAHTPLHQALGATARLQSSPRPESRVSTATSSISLGLESPRSGGVVATPEPDHGPSSQSPPPVKEANHDREVLLASSPMRDPPRPTELDPVQDKAYPTKLAASEHSYHHARIKPPPTPNPQVRKKTSNPTPHPCGIYERSLQQKERRAREIEAKRMALLEKELANTTFHPKITKRAESLHRRRSTSPDLTTALRLRERLKLLELAHEDATTPTFTPRLSRRTAELARHCRTRAASSRLPISERLYRGDERAQTASRCATRAEGSPRPKPLTRTPSAINEHLASMFRREREKQEAIHQVREQVLKEQCTIGARPVDPTEVVKRLTSPQEGRTSSARRSEPDPAMQTCTFAPRLSRTAREYATKARERGWTRWFLYFSKPNRGTLTVHELRGHTGRDADIASRIEATLTAASPSAKGGKALEKENESGREEGDEGETSGSAAGGVREWTLPQFLDALTAAEKKNSSLQIWREFPTGEGNGALLLSARKASKQNDPEPSFHPDINARSRRLGQRRDRANAAAPLPIHQRLYLIGRQQQLARAERELEEKRQVLVSEQEAAEKRSRSIGQWRRQLALRARESKPGAVSPATDSAAAGLTPRSPITQLAEREPHEERCAGLKHPPAGRQVPHSPSSPSSGLSQIVKAEGVEKAAAHPELTRHEQSGVSLKGKGQDTVKGPPWVGGPNPSNATGSSPQQAKPKRAESAATASRSRDPFQYDAAELRTTNVIIECAKCRDPYCFPPDQRRAIERENKRRLRELGRLLYRKSRGLCE